MAIAELVVESCDNCHFQRDGECHRKAPNHALCQLDQSVVACWPLVAADQWCGEWKHAEGRDA